MAYPTFASVDFGFGNDDADNFRSFVRVFMGPLETRRVEFAYPGVDGVSVQQNGSGARTITWLLQVVAKSEAALNTLEGAMDAVVGSPSQTMTVRGQTLTNVELVSYAETKESIPLVSPWLQARVYEVVFRDLTPGV